jgi:hypothetical protein
MLLRFQALYPLACRVSVRFPLGGGAHRAGFTFPVPGSAENSRGSRGTRRGAG